MADALPDDSAPVDAPAVAPAQFAALAADPLAAHLGIELEEVRPGDSVVAEGVELHRNGRTAAHRIDAATADGQPAATALARVFRLGTPWQTGPAPAATGAAASGEDVP